MTNNMSSQQIIDGIINTPFVESYADANSEATLQQAIYMILQLLSEKNISNDILTVNKIDGNTLAMKYQLNSAITPTSITRII